jgi:hypothetical protein
MLSVEHVDGASSEYEVGALFDVAASYALVWVWVWAWLWVSTLLVGSFSVLPFLEHPHLFVSLALPLCPAFFLHLS